MLGLIHKGYYILFNGALVVISQSMEMNVFVVGAVDMPDRYERQV
jgi:hypothetical protein